MTKKISKMAKMQKQKTKVGLRVRPAVLVALKNDETKEINKISVLCHRILLQNSAAS